MSVVLWDTSMSVVLWDTSMSVVLWDTSMSVVLWDTSMSAVLWDTSTCVYRWYHKNILTHCLCDVPYAEPRASGGLSQDHPQGGSGGGAEAVRPSLGGLFSGGFPILRPAGQRAFTGKNVGGSGWQDDENTVCLSGVRCCSIFNFNLRALLAWETYVYITKASEIDNKQKWNK